MQMPSEANPYSNLLTNVKNAEINEILNSNYIALTLVNLKSSKLVKNEKSFEINEIPNSNYIYVTLVYIQPFI